MSFFCKHCDVELVAPSEWGGMSLPCPSCSQATPLQHKLGHPIAPSASGYGITFGEFVRLVNDEGWRETAQPLIEQLLSCSIEPHGNIFVLRTKNGTFLPYEVAHLQLQADADAQRRLYNLAMDLWR